MKKNIFVLGCLLTIGIASISCSNDRDDSTNTSAEVVVAEAQLPETSKTFIATHFPNESIVTAQKETVPTEDGTLYQVKLSNDYQVNFDKNGNYTGVKGLGKKIPNSIVNLIDAINNIKTYIKENYPNAIITEIEKKSYGYEIEINDDIELKFDTKGNFLGIKEDSTGSGTVITITTLPEVAKSFLSTHFSGVSAIKVEKEKKVDTDGTLYEVKLSNGFQVDFDVNGVWTGVDGNGQVIPNSIISLIPSTISKYITSNYPNAIITEVEKKSYGYEIEINNKTEIKFDANGNILGGGSSNGGGTVITTNLPEVAKTFLANHFSGISATKVEKENTPDSDGTLYEVKLSNGFQVDFDVNGVWTGVDGNGQVIPNSIISLIPSTISKYITSNYPNAIITEVEKKSYGYEIEINNKTEIKFDANGNKL